MPLKQKSIIDELLRAKTIYTLDHSRLGFFEVFVDHEGSVEFFQTNRCNLCTPIPPGKDLFCHTY